MSEVREMAIKLFGKTISFPPNEGASRILATATTDAAASAEHCSSSVDLVSSPRTKICNRVGDKERHTGSELPEAGQEYSTSHQTTQQLKDPESSCENPKTPSADKEHNSPEDCRNDEPSENSISQEKTLKKPEKILPCPRCNSMDTKFCYYNNYNANQPRHFCKNCQRYWTAGGNMRSVPVGSGRRKNKSSSASHYPHAIVAEALQATNGIHCPTVRTNETVLTFGSDSPLCESIPSAFNLSEKSKTCEQKICASCGGRENHSITTTDSAGKGGSCGIQEPVMKNCPASTPEVPFFPGLPWPAPWNSSQWSSAMSPTTFRPSAFPVTFYQTEPYWGCAVPGPWNMPWYFCSSPNSSNLGKHTRDGDLLRQTNSEKEPLKGNNSERHLSTPKTLRIDDPSDAAKSSIWSTLGIKNDSTNGGGLFKVFQSKGDEKSHIDEMSAVMQANPAALSRSLNFHESAE